MASRKNEDGNVFEQQPIGQAVTERARAPNCFRADLHEPRYGLLSLRSFSQQH